MEKNRKDLKTLSILILVLVGVSLVKTIVNACVFGLPQVTDLIDGMTAELAHIMSIIGFVLGFVFLLPQVYIGIKGLQVAKDPNASKKAHITCSLILAIFAGIAVITGIVSLVKSYDTDSMLDLVNTALDVVVYAYYYVIARKIASAK